MLSRQLHADIVILNIVFSADKFASAGGYKPCHLRCMLLCGSRTAFFCGLMQISAQYKLAAYLINIRLRLAHGNGIFHRGEVFDIRLCYPYLLGENPLRRL